MENLLEIISDHTKNNVSNENMLINTAGIATVLKILEISLNDDLRRKVNDFARPYEHLWTSKGTNDINRNVKCLNANGVFMTIPINEEFMRDCRQIFDALIMKIDLSEKNRACDEINAWAKEKTEGFIECILQPDDISPALALLLVNCMFFKGSWKVTFNSLNSYTNTFTLSSGKKISMPFMNLEEAFCCILEEDFVAVKLEYADERYCCILAMSQEKDIQDCASKLKMSHVSELIKTQYRDKIILNLPKFDVSSEMNLSKVLTNLGLAEIYDQNAIVKGKIADCDLLVSEAKQLNRIKVDEKGTTAASVTMLLAKMSMPAIVTFNKPFLMIIMDTMHMVPVMGCVIENPQKI
uniref:Serpin 2 n=1 Tax=Sphaerospora molnari TaxID=182359 RepID=A0A7M3V7C1_9CNID|nr:serpin 2 [Sphaerospora molnari]